MIYLKIFKYMNMVLLLFFLNIVTISMFIQTMYISLCAQANNLDSSYVAKHHVYLNIINFSYLLRVRTDCNIFNELVFGYFNELI